jgi:Leucine-rich repeat (LRR) protein
MGNLHSLKTFYVSSNELKKLPISIGNMKSLEIIRLENNWVSNLPDSVGNLSNLGILDIRLNPIRDLPRTLLDIKGNLYSFGCDYEALSFAAKKIANQLHRMK